MIRVPTGNECWRATPTSPMTDRSWLTCAAPITIGNNVRLGGGIVVLPGVTISDNTVVGAGAVVARDQPAVVLAAGNPARIIRTLTEAEA